MAETLFDKYEDKLDWDMLSLNPALTPEIIEENKDKWDWNYLSLNPALTIDLIEKYKDKWHWYWLSKNPALTIDLIEKNKNKLNWRKLSENPNLTPEFIEENDDKLNWGALSQNPALTPAMIDHYRWNKVLDWKEIAQNPSLTPAFIERWKDKLDWSYLSLNPALTMDLIEKYEDKLDWDWLSMNPNLKPEFIEEHKDKFNWSYLSQNPALTMDLIEKNKDKLYWIYLSRKPNLTPKFIEENKDKLDWDRLSRNPVIFQPINKYNPYERMIRERLGLSYKAETPSYCNRCYKGDLESMTFYNDYDDKEYIYYACNRCNYTSEPTVVEDERLKGNTCYMCDKEALFIYEDLPTGAKPFCSEKCMTQYGGMPYFGEGYYGYGIEGTEDAQTKIMLKRMGILKAENNEKDKVIIHQLLNGEENVFGDLVWMGKYKGFKFDISKPSPAKIKKELKKGYEWYKNKGYEIYFQLNDILMNNIALANKEKGKVWRRYRIKSQENYLWGDSEKIKSMPQVKKIIRNFVDSMLDGSLLCAEKGCDNSLSANDFYWCVGCKDSKFYCNQHYYTYSNAIIENQDFSIESGCKEHLKDWYEGEKDLDEEKDIERFINPYQLVVLKRMQQKKQFGNEEIIPQGETLTYLGLGVVSLLVFLSLFKRR